MNTPTALDHNLVIGLEAAVQLHMLTLAPMHPKTRDRILTRWAADAADQVASKGDILQFRSKKAGETAEVFNHLARGLAAAAHQPGGITFAGRHWCANHQQCLDADAQFAARPSLLDANPDDDQDDERPTYMGRPVTDLPIANELL